MKEDILINVSFLMHKNVVLNPTDFNFIDQNVVPNNLFCVHIGLEQSRVKKL